MKHLKSYKVFEADGPLQPSEWSWTKDLTIPNDMQLEIHDMSYELRDEGYTIGYEWWPPDETYNKLSSDLYYKNNKYPCINITKRISNDEGLEKIYYGHIKDFCDRVISYLDEMGYNGVVKFRKDNTNDYCEISDSNVNWGPFKDYPMAYSIHFKIEMISRRVYGDVYESNLSQYFEDDVVKKSEEVIADIKDILLELSDVGYETNVNFAPFLRQYLSYNTPTIQINITKPSEDSEMNDGFRFLPLWNSDDEKMEFDDVILRVLYYISSEGYKYEYEGIKSPVKRQIVRYMINIYKP